MQFENNSGSSLRIMVVVVVVVVLVVVVVVLRVCCFVMGTICVRTRTMGNKHRASLVARQQARATGATGYSFFFIT